MLSKDVSCLESIESVQREKELDFPGRVGSMIQRMFSTHEMTLLAARRELSSRRLHQYYSECIGFYVVDACPRRDMAQVDDTIRTRVPGASSLI